MNQDDHYLHTFEEFLETEDGNYKFTKQEFIERLRAANKAGWFSSLEEHWRLAM